MARDAVFSEIEDLLHQFLQDASQTEHEVFDREVRMGQN